MSVSAADAQIMAAKSVETLKRIRSYEMFELFWKHVESLRVNTDTKEPAPPRQRKAPLRYEVGGGDSFHFDSVEDHYRQKFFEAIDLAVTSIEDRFNRPGFLVYQKLEEVIIKAANKEDYTNELEEIVSFYGNDFDTDELSTQLDIFSSNFTIENDKQRITLRECLNHLMTLNIYKNEMDLKQVANEFIRGNEHRMRFFGNFS